MDDSGTDRRGFLKELVTGAGAVAVGTTGCTPTPSFDEAWAAARTADARWQAVRDQFLLEPGYAYLNTGGLGPSPRPVIAAADAAWRALEGRCDTGHGQRADVRRQVCAFVHCGGDEIALTRNATEGMNLVARGLRLERGAEIVMTTHEHPGGAMPWFAAAEHEGFVIKTIEPGSGGDDMLQRLATALTERCDFYVASGHKWLLGPKGTGLLYVRNAMLDRCSVALGFLSTIGMDLVAARAASLAMRLRERLAELREVEILTPPDPGAHAAILTFRLPAFGGDPWDWSNRLRTEHGFRLRPVGEAGLGAVRASTHVFNTEEEIERLGEVLGELV